MCLRFLKKYTFFILLCIHLPRDNKLCFECFRFSTHSILHSHSLVVCVVNRYSRSQPVHQSIFWFWPMGISHVISRATPAPYMSSRCEHAEIYDRPACIFHGKSTRDGNAFWWTLELLLLLMLLFVWLLLLLWFSRARITSVDCGHVGRGPGSGVYVKVSPVA